jgi:hypothetical protein
MDDTGIIARWLETEEAQRLLRKLAQRVAFDLAGSGIQPPFLELPGSRLEDVLPVLISELSLFILEDRPRIKALIAARDPNLPRYLQQAFMNHCRDLVRRLGLDPIRYLRKRAREAFRQSNRIHSELKDGRFLMFSLHADNEEIRLPQDFDHCAINLPRRLAEGLDYPTACKKDNLIDLAVHFWCHLSGILNGRRVWVDLRDFVNWVGCYVPMHRAVKHTEDEGASDDSGPNYMDPWDMVTPGNQALPPPTDQQLEVLAADFAARLDPKGRAVFYWRFFESMNLEEVARRTGFKSPSGPSYRFEEAINVLRSLLRDWPGLSPEDEAPETMGRFLDKLRAILKKTLSVP